MNYTSSKAQAGNFQKKLPTQLLRDPDFKALLSERVKDIRQSAHQATNEATIESSFEQYLFVILREVGVNYKPEKEEYVGKTLQRGQGRTDSRFKNIVFEFKHRSAMKTDRMIAKNKEQLFGYLEKLNENKKGVHIGFLTDGLKYIFCSWTEDGGRHSSGIEDIDDDGLLFICRTIITSRSTALTPDNLVKDFCGTTYDGYLIQAARSLFKSISKTASEKTNMLRSEWESLFRLSHDDTSKQARIQERRRTLQNILNVKIDDNKTEYLCLFSLHTAYSIVIKLISYKIVSDIVCGTTLISFKELKNHDDDTLRSFMSSLEDGELFRKLKIINLLEGDFFSWYSDSQQWNEEVSSSVRQILLVLSRYEDAESVFMAQNAIDLFRKLYEEVVPQVVRSSFGEFYTPVWLSQHVLSTSLFSSGERVLDPCCGSGTFLISALQHLRNENKVKDKNLLSIILNSVVGIDLNPLAVLSARVHYFIYIHDLLDIGDELLIPIFLGDSSNIPKLLGEGTKNPYYSFEISTLKKPITVNLPFNVANDRKLMFRLMNDFESAVVRKDYNYAFSIIKKFCHEQKLSDEDCKRMECIASQIIELEKREWNGIWARIIANFFATVSIGKFQRIIGNPPWVDWKSLPAGYRDTVKSLCVEKKLFSGASRTGGINLNICALITHVAAATWLDKKGRLAFLMPRELAVQASYEGWRSSVGGAGCKLIEMHDWTKAGHPFEPVREDFMTFVIEQDAPSSADVQCWSYIKKDKKERSWLWRNIDEAQAKLSISQYYARPLVSGRTAFTFAGSHEDLDKFALIAGECNYIGREGIEFYPQELMMFRYLRKGITPGTVFVENFQGRKSKYKIPKHEILLETKYLFPLVKGPYISSYNYTENDHIVAFPYDYSNSQQPIDKTRLHNESPLLLAYFLKFQQQICEQTAYSDSIRAKGEFYGVARVGPYSFAKTYVAFRDNTKWGACVITDKDMPWNERKRYLFQNHAVSMCERSDRSFITTDEAHYIAAILNSDIASKFIMASSDTRSFKIRPPLYIPRYSESDSNHKALVELSKQAHLDEAFRVCAAERASVFYLRLCEARIRP